MDEPISEKVLKLLNEHPWKDTLERLYLYAEYKISKMVWKNSWKSSPPEGIQNSDIVQEVILKAFEGRRNWDPERHPDLYLWLQNQIDSEISNLVRSQRNRKQIASSVLEDSPVLEGHDGVTPEMILLRNEDEAESDTFLLQLLDFLGAEPDLARIVEAFIEGVEAVNKRSVFAAYLGITPSELDLATKRLRRRIIEFMKATNTSPLAKQGGISYGQK